MSITDQPTSVVRRTQARVFDASTLPPAGHFIDGAFVEAPGADALPIVDPASEETIAEVANGTAADVDRAVAAAVRAKDAWGRLVPKERSEILHAIANRIAENRDVLARLESANTGKPATVARDCLLYTSDAADE